MSQKRAKMPLIPALPEPFTPEQEAERQRFNAEARAYNQNGEKKVLFNGRTLVVTVTVNTDEEDHEVAARIHEAAQGPKRRMAITSLAALTDDQGRSFWDKAIRGQPS